MATIPLHEFENWLGEYGAAWQPGNAQAAIELFTDDAKYYESPFDDPMIGKDAIRRYWSEGAGESQKDVRFSHEAVEVVESKGLAR